MIEATSEPAKAMEDMPILKTDDIYVMPDKFQPKAGKSSSALMISVIVMVVVLILIGGYYGYDYYSKHRVVEEVNQVSNAATNFGNEQEQLDMPIVATTTEELATTTATTTEELLSTTTQETVSPVSLAPASLSPDTDLDNLTDLEENLVGTSPTNPDTDSDNFKDGDEIINGYSPLIPDSSALAKIDKAGIVKISQTDFASDNFSVPVIKQWSFSTVKATKQAIITTDTGEIIKISVKENPSRLSALDWYLRSNPQILPMQVKQVEYGDLSGIITPDGLSAYLGDPLKTTIYSFEYLMDKEAQFRYPNFFKLMLKRFVLIAEGASASPSSSTSTTSLTE